MAIDRPVQGAVDTARRTGAGDNAAPTSVPVDRYGPVLEVPDPGPVPDDPHRVPGLDDPRRVPGLDDPRREGPHPELSSADVAALDRHRLDVARRHPEDMERLSHDPDQLNVVDVRYRQEALTALDMRERGTLPDDIRRPDRAGEGDFIGTVDGRTVHFDLKQMRDRWPPESGNPPTDRFPPSAGGYDPGVFERKLTRQMTSGRHVVLDTRSLMQRTIDSMAGVVERKGWGERVRWYP